MYLNVIKYHIQNVLVNFKTDAHLRFKDKHQLELEIGIRHTIMEKPF